MAIDGEYAGHIVISDVVKPHAEGGHRAAEACRRAEDGHAHRRHPDSVAEQVAEDLGVDEVYSDLLPADKVAKVEELLADEAATRHKLAFVGDGINDAPVLSRADIGIAMGAMGSDAAIEAADVVLMDDDPMKIAKAIRISRKCLRHRLSEYRVRAGRQVRLPRAWRAGYREYVGRDLRRRWRDGAGRAQRDSRASGA